MKHVNIFVVFPLRGSRPDDFRADYASGQPELQQLATYWKKAVALGLGGWYGVRTVCYTAQDACLPKEEVGADYWMRKSFEEHGFSVEAFIRGCDVVAVLGGALSAEMMNHITIAVDAGKPVCVCSGLFAPVRNSLAEAGYRPGKVQDGGLLAECEKVIARR